jgi:hypothetical protein
MLQNQDLGVQIIHFTASLPKQAEGLRPFLMSQVVNLRNSITQEWQVRKAATALNAVLASPLCRDLELDFNSQPDLRIYIPQAIEGLRFDVGMYSAALAYYGLPQDYHRIFAKLGEGLEAVTAQQAANTNRACWLQVNETAADFPIKKPSRADITTVRNIQLDFEYPPEPQRCHAVGVELVFALASQGYISQEGQPIVEDSGAGCHIVLPIAPLETNEHGGGEAVNEAVASVVRRYFEPEFNRIARRYHLDKAVKLEAFDISRIFSVPGTWRPGNSKPNEADYLRAGYMRRWLPPYIGQTYPTRHESQVLTDLVKAECVAIATQPKQAPQPVARTHRPDVAVWLEDYARRNPPMLDAEKKAGYNRSGYFYSLVMACKLRFDGDESAPLNQADLIDRLAGSKYGRKAYNEVERALKSK